MLLDYDRQIDNLMLQVNKLLDKKRSLFIPGKPKGWSLLCECSRKYLRENYVEWQKIYDW